MTMAKYLWSAAEALRLQVRPAIGESTAQSALDNALRVLTAVANALEPTGPMPTPAAYALTEAADTDRLGGPAENAAVHRDNGAAIAAQARLIAQAGTCDTPASRSAVAWEKSLLDAAVARYDSIERAQPTPHQTDGSQITPEAIVAYLRTRADSPDADVTAFKLVTGGRSRQTAVFSVENGGDLPSHMVIQRGIPGQVVAPGFISETAQFDLLTTLHAAGMRVPRPVLVETDPARLGAAFLIVERAPGTPALTDYWGNITSTGVALDLAREMAKLHALPVTELGFDLPQSRDDYSVEGWRAELDRLAAEWNTLAHWPSITMSAVIAWMRANVDALDDRRALVHNDMVFHNILANDDAISAVLDWEQTNIGHPGEDLGYCFPYVSAMIDWDQFIATYRDAGGPDLPQRQIDYFALRGGLRLMTLVLRGGRDSFEHGLSNDVLVASAGAHFTQRLLHRIAGVLDKILARS